MQCAIVVVSDHTYFLQEFSVKQGKRSDGSMTAADFESYMSHFMIRMVTWDVKKSFVARKSVLICHIHSTFYVKHHHCHGFR